MNVKLRLSALGLALLVPALLMVRWSISNAGSAPVVHELRLPRQVGIWHATQEERLSDEIWSIIEPDAHLLRLYEAPDRRPIWIYVGLYGGRTGAGKTAHDPEVCFPAQGWEILERRSGDVPLPTGETLPATVLEAHLGVQHQTALYWFQPAARWPVGSAGEQLMRIYDAITGRPQYAFVRFTASSDGQQSAADDLAEFAAEIAPAIRRAVERLGAREVDESQQARL